MTKKVIGEKASSQADAVAAIRAAAEQRVQPAPAQQDAVAMIKAAAAQREAQQPTQQQAGQP